MKYTDEDRRRKETDESDKKKENILVGHILHRNWQKQRIVEGKRRRGNRNAGIFEDVKNGRN